MKVTYQAVQHTNKILVQTDKAVEAFTATPEIFRNEFWEFVHVRAENPKYAQDVLEELDTLASKGVTLSPFVASHLVKAMRIARQTLRHEEFKKF